MKGIRYLLIVMLGVLLTAGLTLYGAAAREPNDDDPPTTPAITTATNPLSEAGAADFAEQFDAIFDGPNLDLIDTLFAPDYVGHLPLTADLDRDGLKNYVSSFYAALPDMTETVNEVVVGADRVVLHVTYTATQDGPLFGIAPTGMPVRMDGIGIFRFDDNGQVVENWAVIDVAGMLAQIGAFPPGQQESATTGTNLPVNAYPGCLVALGADNCLPYRG